MRWRLDAPLLCVPPRDKSTMVQCRQYSNSGDGDDPAQPSTCRGGPASYLILATSTAIQVETTRRACSPGRAAPAKIYLGNIA